MATNRKDRREAGRRAAEHVQGTHGSNPWLERRRGHPVVSKASGARLVRTRRGRLVLVTTPLPSEKAKEIL